MTKLTTPELKYYVMKYYRIERQMPIVCTECHVLGSFIADVIAADDKEVIEVEIKNSYSDFSADFDHKQAKHTAYLNTTLHVTGATGASATGTSTNNSPDISTNLTKRQTLYIPNRFFYACTPDLGKEILPKLTGLPYGLIVVDPKNPKWNLNSSIKIVKQASKINQIYPSTIRKNALARMSSEIINLYETLLNL